MGVTTIVSAGVSLTHKGRMTVKVITPRGPLAVAGCGGPPASLRFMSRGTSMLAPASEGAELLEAARARRYEEVAQLLQSQG